MEILAKSSGQSPKSGAAFRMLAVLLGVSYAILFVLPGWVFFDARGGMDVFNAVGASERSAILFPLFGLYAFFFVWAQAMLGSLMPLWRRIFPWVETFHRTEGVFALLFAVIHPLLIVAWVGMAAYLRKEFVAPSQHVYVWIGQIQLVLLMLTAGTALLMKVPWLRTRWHLIHLLNYALFGLIWVHSWYLGSDVQGTPLRYIWYFYALTFIGAVVFRLRRIRRPASSSNVIPPVPLAQELIHDENFVRIAAEGEIVEGKPFCTEVNGVSIAAFFINGAYYAIDNACSHAGGALCRGELEGTTVTCPLHFSQFDVTTGAVLRPPAMQPQKAYSVRVRNGGIEIKPKS